MIRPLVPVLPLLAVAAACQPAAEVGFAGYVEGEFVYLAAPQAGYLRSLEAPRGSRVTAGAPVFVLADDPDAQALAEAEARAGAARERVQNLKAPRRAEEVAALQAARRAAQAGADLAGSQLRKQEALAEQGFISGARLDEARSQFTQARAVLESTRQQLVLAQSNLGRAAETRAAEADLQAAAATSAQKRWALERKAVHAPAPGEVAETYYRPGEWVPAGAPVASLLPDARRRLRFFVPEAALAGIRPGQAVEAACDGCPAPLRATVDFVSPQAEYTPPVIYSRGSREKLVFRVEAAPLPEQAAHLRPGLPVEVRLATASSGK